MTIFKQSTNVIKADICRIDTRAIEIQRCLVLRNDLDIFENYSQEESQDAN